MMQTGLAALGDRTVASVEAFGRFTRFAGEAGRWCLLGQRYWMRPRLIMPQLYQIGTRSLSVIALLSVFVGMVLSIEAYDQFAAIGQETRLGGAINISVVKQIGPVLAAVMIAGRVGGSISAELGTMRITEQIDAMRVMGTDPIAHLVLPRVLACIVMSPALTAFGDLLGVLGAYGVTVRLYGVDSEAYWEFSRRFVTAWDVMTGLVKALVFGLALGLISCYKGFHCRGGASGVGRAATEAFVSSFITIIILNLFLAKLLKDLYRIVYDYTPVGAFTG